MKLFSTGNIRNTLGVIALLVVIGGLYWYFFGGSAAPEPPLSATAPASDAAQQFLDLAGELAAVSFNTSIFSDPRFNSLVDISTTVIPEAQGRPDPFAPIAP
jgi:hypothetical protein